MKKRTAKRILIICLVIAAAAAMTAGIVMDSMRVDVCLDPGHGGDDSGAQYEGRLEKDDNLELALAVEKELKARGVKVCMTRDDDTFISLAGRCRKANIRQAKLFVALHRNSAENAHGVEIWIHSDSPPKDTALAQNICDALATAGISENRGVKSGFAREDGEGRLHGLYQRLNSVKSGFAREDGENYFVNSRTNMPSCLAEIGFITDDGDNRLFDDNLDAYAEAIADGIAKTLNEI